MIQKNQFQKLLLKNNSATTVRALPHEQSEPTNSRTNPWTNRQRGQPKKDDTATFQDRYQVLASISHASVIIWSRTRKRTTSREMWDLLLRRKDSVRRSGTNVPWKISEPRGHAGGPQILTLNGMDFLGFEKRLRKVFRIVGLNDQLVFLFDKGSHFLIWPAMNDILPMINREKHFSIHNHRNRLDILM